MYAFILLKGREAENIGPNKNLKYVHQLRKQMNRNMKNKPYSVTTANKIYKT